MSLKEEKQATGSTCCGTIEGTLTGAAAAAAATACGAAASSACALRLSSSLQPMLPRSPISTGAGCWKRSSSAPDAGSASGMNLILQDQEFGKCFRPRVMQALPLKCISALPHTSPVVAVVHHPHQVPRDGCRLRVHVLVPGAAQQLLGL